MKIPRNIWQRCLLIVSVQERSIMEMSSIRRARWNIFEHGIGASIMCEASRDYLLNLLRMYAEKGEKYTFAYLKNDLKNDMSGYDKISPFQQCKKILRLDRISCICDLKYYHTYSIICNVNQIRSLGCTITCYFEPTFIYHGTSYNRPDVKP